MKNILVTGGFGFVGFNAIRLWKATRPQYRYFVADARTYAAQYLISEKLSFFEKNGVEDLKIDLSDATDVFDRLKTFVVDNDIDTIVNYAAESHVDNSIKDPVAFFRSNVLSTVNLLNLAVVLRLKFHHISTDEVYGETYPGCNSNENAILRPSSPYSASKAAADLSVIAWNRTYGLGATVSRCSNNFGPWQHDEKFIPMVLKRISANEPVPVYGDGRQMRHWIFVDCHNSKVMDILEGRYVGHDILNIAPTDASYMTNLEVIERIGKSVGNNAVEVRHVEDRLGHDKSYFLKSYAIEPIDTGFDERIRETARWYLDRRECGCV